MTKKHNPKKKRARKQATPSEIASAQQPEPAKPEPKVPTLDDFVDSPESLTSSEDAPANPYDYLLEEDLQDD
jgi:hypothetical protein